MGGWQAWIIYTVDAGFLPAGTLNIYVSPIRADALNKIADIIVIGLSRHDLVAGYGIRIAAAVPILIIQLNNSICLRLGIELRAEYRSLDIIVNIVGCAINGIARDLE